MKKILMVLIVLSIVSYAYEYEYLVYHQAYETYYVGDDGVLYYKDGDTMRSPMGGKSWGAMSFVAGLKHDTRYVSRSTFINYLKSDNRFINDMFKQAPQLLLNFYLNNDVNHFHYLDYIEYNYELLYDADGYAVEAIVGDVWVGKYDDSEKNISGNLYDNSGKLIYRNGEKVVNFFDELLSKLDFTDKFVNASILIDIVWFVVAVLSFSVLFWVIHHVVDGLRYGYSLYKNRR